MKIFVISKKEGTAPIRTIHVDGDCQNLHEYDYGAKKSKRKAEVVEHEFDDHQVETLLAIGMKYCRNCKNVELRRIESVLALLDERNAVGMTVIDIEHVRALLAP